MDTTEKKQCTQCNKVMKRSEFSCPQCQGSEFRLIAASSPIFRSAQVASSNQVSANSTSQVALNSSRIEELLEKNIAASNRTTHAVRAFVRFLFIQLSATSLAYLVWNLADNSIDAFECSQFRQKCAPNAFLSFLGAAIFITGVVWSSRAGWSELAESDIL